MRYSYLSCTPCVDDVVALINEFGKQNRNIEIIILATYRFRKDLKSFKRLNKVFTHVYNVKSLDLPVEEKHLPYLFVLDKNMRVMDLFIPRKEVPELTSEYLERIKVYNHL